MEDYWMRKSLGWIDCSRSHILGEMWEMWLSLVDCWSASIITESRGASLCKWSSTSRIVVKWLMKAWIFLMGMKRS